jgi:hypothetical protein
MGRASFRAASHHRLASEFDLVPVFDTLSERFEPIRLALNGLAARVFSVGDPDCRFLSRVDGEAKLA